MTGRTKRNISDAFEVGIRTLNNRVTDIDNGVQSVNRKHTRTSQDMERILAKISEIKAQVRELLDVQGYVENQCKHAEKIIRSGTSTPALESTETQYTIRTKSQYSPLHRSRSPIDQVIVLDNASEEDAESVKEVKPQVIITVGSVEVEDQVKDDSQESTEGEDEDVVGSGVDEDQEGTIIRVKSQENIPIVIVTQTQEHEHEQEEQTETDGEETHTNVTITVKTEEELVLEEEEEELARLEREELEQEEEELARLEEEDALLRQEKEEKEEEEEEEEEEKSLIEDEDEELARLEMEELEQEEAELARLEQEEALRREEEELAALEAEEAELNRLQEEEDLKKVEEEEELTRIAEELAKKEELVAKQKEELERDGRRSKSPQPGRAPGKLSMNRFQIGGGKTKVIFR